MTMFKSRLCVVVLWALCLLPGAWAQAEEASSKAPFALPRDKIAGKGLGEFAPWPKEMVLAGTSEHTLSELFSGEFVVGVYQAKPITLDISSPWPFDELVMVLSGELRLKVTGAAQAQSFPAGSHVIVPRGFTGTWEMAGDYREMWIVEKDAYLKSQEPGGLMAE